MDSTKPHNLKSFTERKLSSDEEKSEQKYDEKRDKVYKQYNQAQLTPRFRMQIEMALAAGGSMPLNIPEPEM